MQGRPCRADDGGGPVTRIGAIGERPGAHAEDQRDVADKVEVEWPHHRNAGDGFVPEMRRKPHDQSIGKMKRRNGDQAQSPHVHNSLFQESDETGVDFVTGEARLPKDKRASDQDLLAAGVQHGEFMHQILTRNLAEFGICLRCLA